MINIPDALKPMSEYVQFINYQLVPGANGKMDKKPCFDKGVEWQTNSSLWQTAESAIARAKLIGDNFGVGFLFTKSDPFFFLDIDDCLTPTGWADLAIELMSILRGSAIEISQSGTGLHIFGKYSGDEPLHSCKNSELGIELYTSGRFVALTGTGAVGSAGADMTVPLQTVINKYFPPKLTTDTDWTTEPVEGYTGPEDDNELIKKACKSNSAGNIFNGNATFKDLWEANEDILSQSYPDNFGSRSYDGSSADAALAQHLAFWTGKNCERMRTLMLQSALVRDKWEREDYLYRTILFAVSVQNEVYSIDNNKPNQSGLKGTPRQIAWAETIRAQKWAENTDEKLKEPSKVLSSAKFWIDHQDKSADEILKVITPTDTTHNPLNLLEPQITCGYQYLGAEQQIEYFKGCCYIQDAHKIFTPSGMLLKTEQFNATYGGYIFQIDDAGQKTTKKAWEAFTESQVVRYPKAESSCFKPLLPPGDLIKDNNRLLINTYMPIETPRVKGDPTLFLNHLKTLLPDGTDQIILLSYLAACLQYKGIKFQWAPLLQGVEGNGKSLFTYCMRAAIGSKYIHMPRASEISEKYNAWLFNKLFIGVEDIYTPGVKHETWEILKPMITGDELERRAMQTDQTMMDLCCNFLFNSNHKDAIKKTKNDRRIAPFFTAQQNESDLIRDGLHGNYFPRLYDWLKKQDGYAIVTNFLYEFDIPDKYNPATECHRAPATSSTNEAIHASMGIVEQEIIEAIDEGQPGFCGGWISSKALAELLKAKRRDMMIPLNKRRDLLKTLGYDWHPILKDGRVNNAVMPDNSKPRLFIKLDHPDVYLQSAAEVANAYQEAQTKALFQS